ncbi:DUF2651 family protein [Zongyangia hominis]|uniref:DUF2651 family protein n=1 Tax=Zongyangia hominis TaxID=2763677 RepID=A0A926EAT9_9FIRM|nr:DUF2651 family protein [Zongyangia hominis]MBC8570487.1 DUF2651 family protein [Zongyangia hominis]
MNLTKSGKILFCALTVALVQLLLYLSSGFVNPFLLVLTLLPLLTILLTVALTLLIRTKWMVIATLAVSYILGMFLFFNTSFWVWVAVYTVLALATTVLIGMISRKES